MSIARGTTPPATTDLGAAVRALRYHGLAPLAHLRTRDSDPPLSRLLRPDLEEAVSSHLRTRGVLPALAQAMDGAGVPWVVLKGPVLSELAHPVPGVRPYVDLDVLVSPADLRTALGALESTGWSLLDADHPQLLDLMPGELHLGSSTGVVMDLHWSVVNDARTRAAFPVRSEALLARRRSVRIGTMDVPTLDQEDLLLHACLHLALTTSDRLVRLLDVHELVSRGQYDWDAVVVRAREWGAGPATALVLSRSSVALGTLVPPELPRALAGSRWWPLLARGVERLSPAARADGRARLSRLVARSSRPTAAATRRELLARSRAHLVPGTGAPPTTQDHHPSRSALDRYLDLVRAGDPS